MQNKMQKKPRILCLHGFRTSAEILKHVIRKAWPETVLEMLDLHFLDAPFPAQGRSDVEGIFCPPYFEWFQFNLAATFEYSSSHFEKSIAYIEDYMTKHGPFDSLLGFSQGAVVAALLPDMQTKGIALTKVPKIKFLILISGAKFEEINVGHHKLASSESPVGCPSLHFIGDKCYLKERGILLLKSFVDPVVIHHPRGHTIPKLDGKSLETTLAFIEKIQKIMSHDLWKKMDVKSAL